MSQSKLPSLLDRHWAESALAIGAIVIAAASLWVGYDTMRTNHRLVVAASWPFLEQNFSDATYTQRQLLTVDVTNAGIGPAKVESVELLWHGKAYRSADELLHVCCDYVPNADRQNDVITSTLQGWVMRPGETVHLIWYRRPATDPAPWEQFKAVVESADAAPKFRICYCSAFNQCWLTNGHELDPPRVKVCPVAKVPLIG
jgi:hypothetical protein